MAYMNQEKKAQKEPALKALAKEYGLKISVAVQNHSTIVLNISQGKIDFYEDYKNKEHVNKDDMHLTPYNDNLFTGLSKEFLSKAFNILNDGNYNNSDAYTDYFDVGFYVKVNIGTWKRGYKLIDKV